MEIVLDTVSIKSLIRPPRPSRRRKRSKGTLPSTNPLDEPIKYGQLKLVFDRSGGLLDQWKRTCNPEAIKALINRWQPWGGIRLIEDPPTLGTEINYKLSALGFPDDTIDKLVLKLANQTSDGIVVSDDSHFWDPTSPDERGNPNAPVARLCKEGLSITILLLKMLIIIISK